MGSHSSHPQLAHWTLMAPIRMWAFFSVAAAILVILPAIAYATDYIVGDNDGWTTGFDYSEWAKDKKFRVGDALIFIYSEGYHSVAKVDGKGFTGCAVPPNATVLTSGNDKITLTTTGNKWYICGVSGHCEAGQKLKITVLPKSMIGGPPSPAPEVAVPGFSWPPVPVPVATPGYLPEDMMNIVPIRAPDSALPWLPWAPAPVETPGYMPGEEEGAALQTMPTMPPGTWVLPEPVSPPAMPPVAGGPWVLPEPVSPPAMPPVAGDPWVLPPMLPEPVSPPAMPPVAGGPWVLSEPVSPPAMPPVAGDPWVLPPMLPEPVSPPAMPPVAGGPWVLPEPISPPAMPPVAGGPWVLPEPVSPPAMPPVAGGPWSS